VVLGGVQGQAHSGLSQDGEYLSVCLSVRTQLGMHSSPAQSRGRANVTMCVSLRWCICQDAAWREQQRRMLSAQFGPREVESAAMNEVPMLPGLSADGGIAGYQPLAWLRKKELNELEVCLSFCLSV
jgi:hypothetical protein